MAMRTKGKEEAIAQLLSEGTPAAELIRRGHSRGTVYKVARRLAEEDNPQESASKEDHSVDSAIENDPEVLQLKKDLRKAQLEREIMNLKGSVGLEERLRIVEERQNPIAEKA